MTTLVSSVRITAVSYLNTLPFIYGLEQQVAVREFSPNPPGGKGEKPSHGDVILSLAVPSEGVKAILNGDADIALIPVGAVPAVREKIPTARIITDYCIGAEGNVETVALFSDSPLEDIHTIYLDSHSRTSVLLARILADERWKIAPEWIDSTDIEQTRLEKGEAFIAIGDKTFEMTPKYAYKYDLAEEWARLTGGMPFVFAVWVAANGKGTAYAPKLNEALRYGVEHIAESITDTVRRSRNFDFGTAHRYLTENIKFNFDERKQEALELFWTKIITPG